MQVRNESQVWSALAQYVEEGDVDGVMDLISQTDDWMEMEAEKAPRRKALEAVADLIIAS